MDNVSHTLAGLLLAEVAFELSAARSGAASPRFRALCLFGSALANNLPDFDFVYARVTGGPLGYLLHHRGHTHTLPVAVALGAVALGATWPFARARLSRAEKGWLAALCLAGPLAHIAMDFTNNYGVHPFWPIFDGWLYGDAVFIVEPFFWAVVIPALVFAARRLAWRIGLGSLLAVALGASWLLPFIPKASAVGLVAVALAMIAACAKARPLVRLALAVFGSWLVAAIFFAGSARAKSLLRAGAPATDTILDLIATPMPANPFCFDAWLLATHDRTYVARRAVVASLARIVPAARCPIDPSGPTTAPLTGAPGASTDDIRWRGAFVAPVAELQDLASRNCRAAAFLRYARAPYWTHVAATPAGSGPAAADAELVVGDLRYDRHPGLDFADIVVARGAQPDLPCPAAIPPWRPPRHDLLESTDRAPTR